MPILNDNAHVRGSVRVLLRLEGFAILAMCLALYARTGTSWSQFAALFLVPDVSFVGYLLGAKLGAACYNTMHSELGPLLLAAAALSGVVSAGALPIALIWGAHVGFDRSLGYGLKYPDSFTATHLGLIGKARHRVTLRDAEA